MRPYALMFCGAFALLLSLPGCRTLEPAASLQRFEFLQPHMATMFRMVLYAPDDATARRASAAAFQRIAELARIMSDYNPRSELRQLCAQPAGKPVRVSRDLFDVLHRSQTVASQTDGAFDVTVGPMVQLWRAARKSRALPPSAAIEDARRRTGWRHVRLDARRRTVTLLQPAMQLDLGGIAKGYAADAALAVLRRQGIRSALVAASGDIAVSAAPPGKPGWRVSIAAPDNEEKAAETVLLQNAAISTSGDVEQYTVIGGVHYSHIVAPQTGLGLTNRVQTTVIARDATTSDAFATALCVMEPQRALALVEATPDLAAFILKPRGNGYEPLASQRFRQHCAKP